MPDTSEPSTLARLMRRSRDGADRSARFQRKMNLLLLDQLRLPAWSRVLALGSRDGWAAEEAWRRVVRGYVCGVDLSPRLTDMANRLRGVAGKLEFQAWDGTSLPFPEASFDCVFSSFGFHSYPQPRMVLRELWRVLRPDGDIYLLEADRKSFGGLYAMWDCFRRITDREQKSYYTTSELVDLVGKSGFLEARELSRYEKLFADGQFLATAIIVHARRRMPGDSLSPAGEGGR